MASEGGGFLVACLFDCSLPSFFVCCSFFGAFVSLVVCIDFFFSTSSSSSSSCMPLSLLLLRSCCFLIPLLFLPAWLASSPLWEIFTLPPSLSLSCQSKPCTTRPLPTTLLASSPTSLHLSTDEPSSLSGAVTFVWNA